MKRKLLITIACFLLIFGSVLNTPKPVKATGYDLTIDLTKDPKKVIIALFAAGFTLTAAATQTVQDNAVAIYNSMSDVSKLTIKSIEAVGDNYKVQNDKFNALMYEFYVTMGLKNLIEGTDITFNNNTFNRTSTTLQSSTHSGVNNYQWSNSNGIVINNSLTSNTFTGSGNVYLTGTRTVTLKNSYFTGDAIWGNLGVYAKVYTGSTIIYQNMVTNPIGMMTAYCTAYATLCSNSARQVLMTEWIFDLDKIRIDLTNWAGSYYQVVGNKIYYVPTNPQFVDTLGNQIIELGKTNITLVNPVNPSQTFPDITWDNAVPGDIDVYPDNVVNNDIYFGGATSDVIDLTPDLVTHPVLPDPLIITNPILDVLIHLPAYLEATGDAINDFASSLVDSASGALGATLGAVGGWIGNLVNGVQQGLAAILAYLGTMLTDLINAIGKATSMVVAATLDGFSDVKNTASGWWDWLKQWLTGLGGLINLLKSFIVALWGFVQQLFFLLYNALFLGIFAYLSTFIYNIKSLMAILPDPLDSISYVLIDIAVFMTMLAVILKVFGLRKG